MKQPESTNRLLDIHPLFFALYPLVYYYSRNLDFVPPADARELFVYWGLAATALLAGVWFIASRRAQACIVVSASFIIALPYNPYLSSLAASLHRLMDTPEAEKGADLILAGVLSVIAAFFVLCRYYGQWLNGLRVFLTCSGFIFTAMLCPSIAAHFAAPSHLRQPPSDLGASLPGRKGGSIPTIFYLIVDGYGRSDVLKTLYAFDNAPFIDFLKQRGFYIAEQSTSNYVQTALSLASSLNLDQLPQLAGEMDRQSRSRSALIELLQRSRAYELAKKAGYEFVTFSTGYGPSEQIGSDRIITPFWSNIMLEGMLSAVDLPLLRTSISYWLHGRHAARVENILKQLPLLAGEAAPRFVFAHIIAPHPPFVFGPEGRRINPTQVFRLTDGREIYGTGEYVERYRDQVSYLNSRLEQVIDAILNTAGDRTVIIIQGDHGPGSQLDWTDSSKTNMFERFSILNAYYFPDKHYERLYASITPVNSLRVIFDQYLGAAFERTPDQSYYSSFYAPWDFIAGPELARRQQQRQIHSSPPHAEAPG